MRSVIGIAVFVGWTLAVHAAPLQLELGADLYQGGADFEVMADGDVVGRGTAKSANGERFEFEVPDNVTEVGVRFKNDLVGPKDADGQIAVGADRNLIIISAAIGDKIWEGDTFTGAGFARGNSLVVTRNSVARLQIGPRSADSVDKALCDANIKVGDYANGEVTLEPAQKQKLAPILETPRCRITVTGYSSTAGAAGANKAISLKRAQAVLDYLIQSGATFSSQDVTGFGETEKFGASQASNRIVVVELY